MPPGPTRRAAVPFTRLRSGVRPVKFQLKVAACALKYSCESLATETWPLELRGLLKTAGGTGTGTTAPEDAPPEAFTFAAEAGVSGGISLLRSTASAVASSVTAGLV